MRPPNIRISVGGRSCDDCAAFTFLPGRSHTGEGRCTKYPGTFTRDDFVCDCPDFEEDEELLPSNNRPQSRRRLRRALPPVTMQVGTSIADEVVADARPSTVADEAATMIDARKFFA